jgi:putative transcriptional regulator
VATAKTKYLIALGAKIKRIREKQNLTQVDLAAKLNKDQQTIQRIEKGRTNITIYNLHELADALEIDVRKIIP